MSSVGSASYLSFESAHGPDPPIDEIQAHLDLLSYDDDLADSNALDAVPIFTSDVRKGILESKQKNLGPHLSQYGLLGGTVSDNTSTLSTNEADRRVFYNIAAPTSMFICGSQGSGKSHTLSTLLETCLIPCQANQLPRPLTGLVFHYDTFISDAAGNVCEAAYLSSHEAVKVRVLCAPTNVGQIKRIYQKLPNVSVQELRIDQSDLNTKRMLDLMAVSSIQGSGMPLYLHVVSRILRDLRILQQKNDTPFDYGAFKAALKAESMTDGQSMPLQQRLETLESFMVLRQARVNGFATTNRSGASSKTSVNCQSSNSWKPAPGQLTIVDLSCPCITADMACSLFYICLSLFLEQDGEVGRIVALDEAHKYMGESVETQALTDSLLSSIRLQRHLGTRVIISTQEPTVSPKLLDLCSVTIVHRFTSPEWLKVLERHLAGVSIPSLEAQTTQEKKTASELNAEGRNVAIYMHVGSKETLFPRILALRTGEGFVFAPSALIGVETSLLNGQGSSSKQLKLHRLGQGALKIRIRRRVTKDGGRSRMAN